MTDLLADVPPLSRKQRRALARASQRVNLLEGSIRAGKTYTWMIRWFLFVATAPRRGGLLMVGKSRDSVYRNFFEPIENDPTLAVFRPFVHYKQGAPTATIFGRTVHVMGAADNRAENKLRGMTLVGAYVDEVTTLPRDFFKTLLGRLSVPGAQMFATTNPDAPGHWLKVEYLDQLGTLPDWYVEHFTMDDNPGLTPQYRAAIEREYTGLWHRRFIRGEWVAAEGAVYPEFDQYRHVVPIEQVPTITDVLAVGVDYGDIHRTRGYLVGLGTVKVGPDGALVDETVPGAVAREALFVLDEFSPVQGTIGQIAVELRAWMDRSEWGAPGWVFVDPAAAAFRRELFDIGITNARAHNSVLSGIQTVGSLLASGGLYIVGDNCPELVKYLPGYRWDSAASSRGTTKPIKQDDDEVDALRYTLYSSRRFWRDRIPLAAAQSEDSIDTEEAA